MIGRVEWLCHRGARYVLALAASALVAGCASLSTGRSNGPAPDQEWPITLTVAQARAGGGDFDAADSVLAGFAARYPGTRQALETAYWRALYRMDPSNRNASVPTAMASLDAYLADPSSRDHVSEAMTLRRVAAQVQGLNKLAATAMAQASSASSTAPATRGVPTEIKSGGEVVSPSSDAEIKRLKDELAKANAELERIRKRLSQPPPRS